VFKYCCCLSWKFGGIVVDPSSLDEIVAVGSEGEKRRGQWTAEGYYTILLPSYVSSSCWIGISTSNTHTKRTPEEVGGFYQPTLTSTSTEDTQRSSSYTQKRKLVERVGSTDGVIRVQQPSKEKKRRGRIVRFLPLPP
jgi:hypothetical protein